MDSNYKPNSHKYKEEQAKKEAEGSKKVEKVVQGKVTSKKKSEIRKLTDIFVSDDVSNVKNYILLDVLVPSIKKAISDIVTNGIDMILYGESGRKDKKTPGSRYSYDKQYNRENRSTDYTNRTRTNYSYDDIILDNRGEAEEVLSRMDDIIAEYGMVSVADLYDLVGVTCNYTDNYYGWKNLSTAHVAIVRDGYLLKFPKAGPLK